MDKLSSTIRALVTGAGGFIGRHLVSFLRTQGYWVRGVDLKHPEFCHNDANEFDLLDLRRWEDCVRATAEIDEVYALAADLGEIANQGRTLHSNCLINIHCIEAARQNRVARYLYTSSARVYPGHCQGSMNCIPLKEQDAYPAASQDAYGWANLISERLCIHYRQDYGLETRIVRLPEVFGPVGPWLGGRESALAALCRNIAAAQLEGLHEVEIFGDGEAKSSFCYIDDCLTALHKVMKSDCTEPLNLGTEPYP